VNDSKAIFLEWIGDLLWRQWSALGAGGTPRPGDPLLIDPEALLLFSTTFARHDPRLFDEMLDWLQLNGRQINIQRLLNLHEDEDGDGLGEDQVLSSIGDFLNDKSSLSKWKSVRDILSDYDVVPDPVPLFFGKDGPLPQYGETDERFRRRGLLRPVYNRSGRKSMRPHMDQAPCLLLKLRALFGIQARAEILAYLLSHTSAHPALIAKETGYFKKTVQDSLNEMELSGHIHSFEKGREKHFQLRTEEWTFLKTWNQPAGFPVWIPWPQVFAFLTQLWKLETDPKWVSADPRLRAVERVKLLTRYQPDLAHVGLTGLLGRTGEPSFLGLVAETFARTLENPEGRRG
jgi:hypothetical protein